MFFVLILVLLGAPHVARGNADGFSYQGGTPSAFGLTRSEGISSLGAWANNPSLNFTCTGPDNQPYVVGPGNPKLCVKQVEATMSSKLFGNVTVVFDADQLSELRSVDPTDPTRYWWGLPLNQYTVPNANYEDGFLNVTFTEGTMTAPLGGIFNYFNASAASLRAYYGVDPGLQGSNETVQGSTLSFGLDGSAVNTTAVNEYLELQALVPNEPLQISDWAPLNNISVCSLGAACFETQLDVEAQQAFAPQAVTFYTPTGTVPVSYYVEAARSAGYTEDKIQQFTAGYETKGQDSSEVNDIIDLLKPAALKAYFRDFVSNVTSSQERIQVASLSWNADYTLADDDFTFFEDGLKNLTLSGITVRG